MLTINLGFQLDDHMRITWYNIFIPMTNEELTEELYHKAHKKGFFNELHDKVGELSQKTKFKCRHELVRTAYDELKKIKLAQPHPHL